MKNFGKFNEIKEADLILTHSTDYDWEGLYVNGELQVEGHGIYDRDWIEVIQRFKVFSGNIESYEVADEYMDIRGSFPHRFDEIPKEYLR